VPERSEKLAGSTPHRLGFLFDEFPRPASVRDRPRAHWLAIGAVCIGAFMGQLDASIVTIAFPSFEHAFHTGIGPVTWVGLSYLLSLVAFVTIVGRFADMAGRKLLYTYGFVLFALASGACALAPNLATLVGLRIVQGLAAAMLQANSLAIIKLAAPPGELGRAVGFQGAAQALGLALGPTVGGLLIAAGGWRLIFFVNVPVGAVGVAAATIFVPRSRHLRSRAPLDWGGLLLFVPATTAWLIAISYGDRLGWGSAPVLTLFIVGAAFLLAFLLRERAARHPMVDLHLFRTRSFSAGIGSGLVAYLVTFGVLLVFPYLFERALGSGPPLAGAELMAMPLSLAAVAPFAGRIGDRFGMRALTTLGMTLVAAALFVLGETPPSTWAAILGLVVIGVGLGCFTPANNASVIGDVPGNRSGEASGLVNLTRATGTSLGLALTGLVFARGGGDLDRAAAVVGGYHDAVTFLAGAALVSAAVAALRSRPLAPDEGFAAAPK
jgi:EmrB/QacA subfamily drug resistance transporter